MTTDRKPAAAAWMTGILVATLLLYPVSFGPAVWLCARDYVDNETVEFAYWPILWECNNGPESVAKAIRWATFGMPSDVAVEFWIKPSWEKDDRVVFYRI